MKILFNELDDKKDIQLILNVEGNGNAGFVGLRIDKEFFFKRKNDILNYISNNILRNIIDIQFEEDEDSFKIKGGRFGYTWRIIERETIPEGLGDITHIEKGENSLIQYLDD